MPKLKTQLQIAARAALTHLPNNFCFPFETTLLLTNDATIRRLNREFRGIDKPTNVLSFPQFTARQLSKMGKSKTSMAVGDIVIAYQYVVAEAKKDHKILINHITHLLIYGLLHLFGYDHISESEAGKMERLEKRIMADLGLPDPYKPLPASKGKKRKPKA